MHKHRFGVPMRCHKRVYVRLARPLRRARRAEMKCRCQTGAASERTTASRSLIADHGANWGRELRALWRRSFGRRAARHDEGEIDLKPTTGVSEVLCKSVSVRGLRGQRTDPMGSVR